MGPTATSTVNAAQAQRLIEMMRILQSDPRNLPEAYRSVKIEHDVAMMVQPINGHAFVFIPPVSIYVFESERGSGTDYLRKQMHAEIFFTGVIIGAKPTANIRAAATETSV